MRNEEEFKGKWETIAVLCGRESVYNK